ncbi:hypothetical protein D1007_61376 [Hordeum vulgare]|nr:hypothetical protein D1007_61376 [Hordeum vulgare]
MVAVRPTVSACSAPAEQEKTPAIAAGVGAGEVGPAGLREGQRPPDSADQRDHQGHGHKFAGRGGPAAAGDQRQNHRRGPNHTGRGGPTAMGYNRGGGGHQGYMNYPNRWNDFTGRSNWNVGGGHGGGGNQWHRPLQPPEGNFVEGARGDNFRQRGGVGVRNYSRNNSGPMWKEVSPSTGGEVQKNNTTTDSSQHKNSEEREVARANKAARKKEKLTCYRCGVSGHFVVDCTTILCDICLKPGHTDATCPLLLVPKPIMNIHRVCHSKLMFFETPGSSSVLNPPRLESSRTGMVKVTNGELTAEQVSQQMKRLVSETYSWDPIRVYENSYQVEFPRREDLQRLLTFGVSKAMPSLGEDVDGKNFEHPLVEEGSFSHDTSPVRGSTMQICNEQDNIQNAAATPKVDSILSIPTDLKEKHMMSAMRVDSLQEQEFSKETTSLPSPTTVRAEPTSCCKDNRSSNSKQQVTLL